MTNMPSAGWPAHRQSAIGNWLFSLEKPKCPDHMIAFTEIVGRWNRVRSAKQCLDRKFGSLRMTNGMDAAIGYRFGGAAAGWLPSVPVFELSSKIGGTDACFQCRHTAPAIGRPNHQSHYLQCAVLCGCRLPLLP